MALQAGAHDRIMQLYDQYLEFVTLEPHLFSLNLPAVYLELNRPASSADPPVPVAGGGAPSLSSGSGYDSLGGSAVDPVEACVDRIAHGLFAMCVTADVVPVIRAARGNAAEMVARKLDGRLRDYLRSNAMMAGGGAGGATGGRGDDAMRLLQRPGTSTDPCIDRIAIG